MFNLIEEKTYNLLEKLVHKKRVRGKNLSKDEKKLISKLVNKDLVVREYKMVQKINFFLTKKGESFYQNSIFLTKKEADYIKNHVILFDNETGLESYTNDLRIELKAVLIFLKA